jgi:hypothetical protein
LYIGIYRYIGKQYEDRQGEVLRSVISTVKFGKMLTFAESNEKCRGINDILLIFHIDIELSIFPYSKISKIKIQGENCKY